MQIELNERDYIWSYAGIIASIGSNVIMLPFILYFLDADTYGLWAVFTSLTAITTLFDFGFSVTFARNITYCWNGAKELKPEGVVETNGSEPNWLLIRDILTTCRFIYLALSIIALVLLGLAGTAYIQYIARGFSDNSYLIAWAIYTIAAFLNLYYCYFNSFLRGVGAIADVNKCTTIAKFVQIGMTIALLFGGMGLIGVSVAYLSYGLLFRLMARRCFYRWKGIGDKLKSLEGKTSRVDIEKLFKIVWHNTWREGIISVSNYLLTQGCTIVSSLYMSLADVGIYALAAQLSNAVGNVSASTYTASQPVLQSAVVTGDMAKARETLALAVVSTLGTLVIGSVLVAVIGISILGFIKPQSPVSLSLFFSLCFYQVLLRYRNCFSSYFSCTNRIIYAKSFILSAALCLFLAIVFLGYFNLGAMGLALAQILSQIVFNAWYWSLRAHKDSGLKYRDSIPLFLRSLKRREMVR